MFDILYLRAIGIRCGAIQTIDGNMNLRVDTLLNRSGGCQQEHNIAGEWMYPVGVRIHYIIAALSAVSYFDILVTYGVQHMDASSASG